MTGANAKFAKQLLGGATPAEIKSDCSHCVMLPHGDPQPGASYFNEKARCCTYEPELPNYIVGAILRDHSAENAYGRRTLLERLEKKINTDPWGIRQSAGFRNSYRTNQDLFGRAADLACPHLREGDLGCSIWTHRPSVCSTWYCKHDRGQVGFEFWFLLARLLREAEDALALWCVAELHPSAAALEECIRNPNQTTRPDELGGSFDQARYRNLWGTWAGREMEFYEAAAALVEPLQWPDVERIGGIRLQLVARRTRQAYHAVTSHSLPQHLTPGPFQILQARPGKLMVKTYSDINPLWMPDTVVRLLSYFDGRATEVVLEEIRKNEKIRLHPNLIRRLADHRILSSTTPDGPADPNP